jgi:rRNA maturation endonuclease Nob1
MTADAEQVATRATDALDQVPTLDSALGCIDCSRIFRSGQSCPYCASQSLLNVSDCIGSQRVVERLYNARRSMNEVTEV